MAPVAQPNHNTAFSRVNKNTADAETIKVAQIPSEYRMYVSL